MGSGLEGSTLTAIVSAAAAFTVSIGTYAWRARGIQADLEKQINLKVDELRDRILRDTGEGLTALRQKAVDMEIWNRDNFVRKTEFQNAIDSFTRSVDSLRTEMNGQYARLNDKMDQIIQGKVGSSPPHR
jgi:hypothetical protein